MSNADYEVNYKSNAATVAASITDDSVSGVFKVSVTLQEAGDYDLTIKIHGLEVPTYLTQISLAEKPVTSVITSTFVGVDT